MKLLPSVTLHKHVVRCPIVAMEPDVLKLQSRNFRAVIQLVRDKVSIRLNVKVQAPAKDIFVCLLRSWCIATKGCFTSAMYTARVVQP